MSELFHFQDFSDIEHFVKELHDHIYYYNNHRIKVKLKGLSPVQYRKLAASFAFLIGSSTITGLHPAPLCHCQWTWKAFRPYAHQFPTT